MDRTLLARDEAASKTLGTIAYVQKQHNVFIAAYYTMGCDVTASMGNLRHVKTLPVVTAAVGNCIKVSTIIANQITART
jgi:hypothetical protein